MRSNIRVTRGTGLLEGFLARQRAKTADRLISRDLRSGCLLDVGCGSYPLFLHGTTFARKIGLDKVVGEHYRKDFDPTASAAIEFLRHDIEKDPYLPIANESCAVVTMLAVIEHLAPDRVPLLLREIHRILRAGGLLVVTTPAAWTDSLLRIMAKAGLVSATEIEEHKAAYSRTDLAALLAQVFPGKDVRVGFFEIFMNLWAVARK
ncbi:MAG: methyltransferase domain-containing protein [Desulfomonile tiedjei]|nr:methyltransferase domain-containing protein [Desulfomonile tiedjei]